jgi:hypothetical protein
LVAASAACKVFRLSQSAINAVGFAQSGKLGNSVFLRCCAKRDKGWLLRRPERAAGSALVRPKRPLPSQEKRPRFTTAALSVDVRRPARHLGRVVEQPVGRRRATRAGQVAVAVKRGRGWMRRLRVGCYRRLCPCTVVGSSGWATVSFEAVGRDELCRAVGASRCVGAIRALAHVVGDVPVVALVLRVVSEAVHMVRVVRVAHPARLRWGWSVGSQASGVWLY